LTQGSGWLFRDLDLSIGPKDRLALIGRNGAGKSTLLRLIGGTLEGDKGTRSVQPGTKIVILEQDPDFSQAERLIDYCLAGKDAPEQYEVEAIADQLGIDLQRIAASASGGERRRAAVCRALAMEPDLLLLDEPTNHMDLSAIEWMENWLARYNGAFVVISHDRAFLTRLTRATLWLERCALRRKEVGFGGYEAWEEQVHAEEARAAEKMDAKLKIETHWLARGVTARRKRNQGRLAKLWEMRAARAAMLAPQGTAKMKLGSDDVKTKTVIAAEKVCKSFGDRVIIRDFSLRIQRGDRIGLVGGNGAGKSTLLKLLTGELEPDSGVVKLAQSLNAVTIDQQRSFLSPEKTVRDIVAEGGDWVDVQGARKHVHGYLKDFLFDPGLVEAKVGTLSGGERSRLLLAREFARLSNLLVLDEPTNDLDLETLDLLQEVISDYDGTVLIVSHDRDFLDRTCTVTLGLDGSGRVDIVAGGYADWLKQRQQALVVGASKAKEKAEVAPVVMPVRKVKLSYKDQRDYEILPERIAVLEGEMAKFEAELANGDLYTKNPARFAALTAALDKARAEKEAAEERWLELAEMVEG